MRKTLAEVGTQLKLGARVLKLVFASSPKWASFYFVTTGLGSITPAVTLYLGKLTVDAIVAAIRNPNPQSINLIILYSVLSFSAEAVNSLFGNLAMHGYDVMKDIFSKFAIQKVIEHSADLDLSYFEDPKFHDQLEKVQREIAYRPTTAMSQVVEATSSVVGLFSLLVLLVRLAWWAPLVILIFSVPRLIFRLRYSYWTFSITDSRSPFQRVINQIIFLMTYKDPAKEIRTFNLKSYFLDKFGQLNDKFIAENRALSVRQNGYSFLLDVFGSTIYYVVALFAAFRAISGLITLGDLTMFTSTIRQFQNVLQGVFAYTARFYESNLFLNRYFEFMAMQPRIVNPPRPKIIDAGKPLTIEFRNVSFAYDRGRPILKNINLKISDARDFALVGENGAGKTTLVKLLLRLYEVTSGQILINGTDIREIDLENLRQSVGIIFQYFQTYDMSARENIGFGDIRKINNIGAIRKAARLSGAAEFIEGFPEKYKTMLGKRFLNGEELSGGQWQKVALARAFFKDSSILILDEPTSALDPRSEYDVFRKLIDHTKDKSLILISHRFSTVRIADEIVVLHKGEIVEQGSHQELMKLNGRYAKLYSLQAKWYK
jgi:ATP-binding cassette, subfamily B, bacterial